MTDLQRITAPTLDVLEAFVHAHNQAEGLHGWEIAKRAKRSGPTVYGILDRLEDAGWLEGSWEEQGPDLNRPRRRIYHLSKKGIAHARNLLSERRSTTFQPIHRSNLTFWNRLHISLTKGFR